MSEEVTIANVICEHILYRFDAFFPYISKTYFDKCNFRCLFVKSKHTIMIVYTH